MIEFEERMKKYIYEPRVKQLKLMHQLMLSSNDESVYMTWIYLMPDCPTEYDFLDIAEDDEAYNECFDLFTKLVKELSMRY